MTATDRRDASAPALTPTIAPAVVSTDGGSYDSPIPSVYQTLRRCAPCGTEFYPQKTAYGLPTDYCSRACQRTAQRRATFADKDVPRDKPVVEVQRTPRAPRPAKAPTARHAKVKAVPKKSPRVRTHEERLAHRPSYAYRMIALRGQRGWGQHELAARMGTHQNSIAGWEAGKNAPSLSAFVALARVFGVSLDYLWGASIQSAAQEAVAS